MRAIRGSFYRQRLRRTRPEPPIVGKFIRIANAVPGPEPDLNFPGLNRDLLSEALGAHSEALAGVPQHRAEAIAVPLLEKIVGSWGDPARAYVLGAKGYQGMIDRYNTAIGMRDLLGALADQNPTSPPKNAPDRIYRLPHDSKFLFDAFSLRMVRDNERGAKGAVLEPSEPLKPLLEEVDLRRIKRCAYSKCGNIFWAGRLNKPCCSPACRNAYKQKKHRDRERGNRLYKKRLALARHAQK